MTDKPLDLTTIRARLDAITPGPWHAEHDDPAWDYCVRQGDFGWVTPAMGPEYDSDTDQGRADAEFVAHAPDDIRTLLDEITEDRRLFAKYVGELHSALLDVEQLTSERDALAGALRALVEHEDGPCILDHHGYCQGHNLSRPCSVAAARRLLGLDGTG